ncbi:hypothetical protein FACS1894110_14030 [Spirochaetia bacterium]|nr:hypothetical protein FACS1894110_14030 [Spirochaetia bacterium]
MKRSRRYYIKQIPRFRNETKYNTLDEALTDYTRFKKSISDHFISDMRLKEEYPDLYNIFIDAELMEEEIEMIKQVFYEDLGIVFNDELSSDDYELD